MCCTAFEQRFSRSICWRFPLEPWRSSLPEDHSLSFRRPNVLVPYVIRTHTSCELFSFAEPEHRKYVRTTQTICKNCAVFFLSKFFAGSTSKNEDEWTNLMKQTLNKSQVFSVAVYPTMVCTRDTQVLSDHYSLAAYHYTPSDRRPPCAIKPTLTPCLCLWGCHKFVTVEVGGVKHHLLRARNVGAKRRILTTVRDECEFRVQSAAQELSRPQTEKSRLQNTSSKGHSFLGLFAERSVRYPLCFAASLFRVYLEILSNTQLSLTTFQNMARCEQHQFLFGGILQPSSSFSSETATPLGSVVYVDPQTPGQRSRNAAARRERRVARCGRCGGAPRVTAARDLSNRRLLHSGAPPS